MQVYQHSWQLKSNYSATVQHFPTSQYGILTFMFNACVCRLYVVLTMVNTEHTIGTTGPEDIYFTSFGKNGLSFSSA